MSKAKRRLLDIDVEFISVVNKGANQKRIIYKEDSDKQPNLHKVVDLVKADDDKMMVYGIVYSPDETDSHGDTAEADVIEKAAYKFMRKRLTDRVDKQHDYDPDEGFIAESWITKENDPLFPDVPVGSWAVGIKIEKADTWKAVKEGKLTGLSLAGLAEVETIEKSDNPEAEEQHNTLLEKIRKVFNTSLTELFKTNSSIDIEKDFTKEYQSRIVYAHVYSLIDALNKILYNTEITDKKGAVLGSINQFAKSFKSLDITKSFNQPNVNKNEDETLTQEAQDFIKSTIDEAIKPIVEKMEVLEKSVNGEDSGLKALSDRLEKVEKSTPGSKQVKKEETVEKEEEAHIWL